MWHNYLSTLFYPNIWYTINTLIMLLMSDFLKISTHTNIEIHFWLSPTTHVPSIRPWAPPPRLHTMTITNPRTKPSLRIYYPHRTRYVLARILTNQWYSSQHKCFEIPSTHVNGDLFQNIPFTRLRLTMDWRKHPLASIL